MRISVYMIYVFACLLAIGAAILSGVILLDTFASQQRQSEDAQLIAGEGQVRAMQSIIFNRMTRMQTTTEEHSRQLLLFIEELPADAVLPQTAIQALNQTVFHSWPAALRANNSLNGFGLTLMYTNATTGAHFDRTFQIYWDLLTTGRYNYLYAYTSATDGLAHAYRTVWTNFTRFYLADDMYSYDTYALLANVYKNDDFFDFAQPWASADGNSYWYFTHMRAFRYPNFYVNVQTWDVGISWLGLMQSGLTPNANLVAYDSLGHVMAATNAAEQQRLAQCRGAVNSSDIAAACISVYAGNYPIAEIRDLYNALHTAAWDDLNSDSIPVHQSEVQLSGQRYMAIIATLFSRNNLRTTIVWYQPWVIMQANSVGLTALICILTMLSTFLLTLLGVFGVLRPLMALGGSMRTVAKTLKHGDGEGEAVVAPRKPNIFMEVDQIGKDFETIVVDFLGFSNANTRDNKYAPKDPDEPFAVIFTDIQSSTGLWGRDPAEMSRCVQAHHELIRKLIREHRLYEVKTVGDAFMVTTASAQDALLFALDVQTALYDHDWDWDGADDFYRETTLAFSKLAEGDDEYNKRWCGLRVRIGMHYGRGDVTYDEVSKGYDYYGTVVNAAARIEALAHGGQVVVSEDLLAALPGPLDPGLAVATPLGSVPLRGVTKAPKLVEFKPAALKARTFPPLRVDRANADVGLEESLSPLEEKFLSPSSEERTNLGPSFVMRARRNSAGTHSTTSRGSDRRPAAQIAEELARTHSMVRGGVLSLEVVTQQLLALYHILEGLLRPLAPPQFTSVTKVLAKGWGVPPPRGKAEFGSSGLKLVHRMSETTNVLTHLGQPIAEAYHNPSQLGDEMKDLEDMVELDVDVDV